MSIKTKGAGNSAVETKFIGGNVLEVKQEDRNGVPVGIVEGYIATWDVDRGDWWGVKDQFVRGAFLESINDHKIRNRPIRLKDHHGRTVGGFPIEKVHEDERGLFGVGEINLEVQQGKEAFALAKQGVLSDFSIGFSIEESSVDEQTNLRTIRKALVWEGSIVDEPMNPEANITAVKSVVSFQDLPLADREYPWDSKAALGRVSEEHNDKAFVYRDNKGEKTMLLCDIIDGNLVAVPQAIFAAAKAIGDIPEADRTEVIRHLERYYAKMDVESPFSDDDKQFFCSEDVKEFTTRQFEDALAKSGCFSKGAAKFLASKVALKEEMPHTSDDDELGVSILDELKSLKSLISKAGQ